MELQDSAAFQRLNLQWKVQCAAVVALSLSNAGEWLPGLGEQHARLSTSTGDRRQ